MLVFVLAALLCCLYASDTIIISYCYRFYAHNPSSAKLLLLSEALKLAIASCLYLTEKRPANVRAEECQTSLLSDTESPSAARSSTRPIAHPGMQQPASRWQRMWRETQESAWTVLVFSIPSLCYFATNNLSFYALTLMSAHLYTLLCDLKIISTGLLNYLVLDKRLNRHAVLSLVVLFCGICVGQYSTMRATAGSLKALAAASHFKAAGFALMVLISFISAVASVQTEWVMNHSRYKHESLNLQNMRLYSIGMALNAAYFWQSGGRLEGFLSDMRGPHWAVVLILALMGLITGVLIKHYGNIIKVYASSIASLFAAWVSQVLLQDPPPALFYAGVFMAMAASVQLQRARSSLTGSADGSSPHNKSPRRGQQQQPQQHRIKASLVVPVALAVLVLVFVPQMIPWSRDWVNMQRGRAVSSHTAAENATTISLQLPANLNNPASLVPKGGIDAPMPALPPFEPTCLVGFENRTLLGCWPLNCSLDASCTVQDKSCCAYFNFRMLDDVDRMLYSKGLQGEYALVYGSALGAARNNSLLGSTLGVEMAFSPTALQVLARNSTREQLWRQGYVFWHDHEMWRLCPHDLHPASEFRAVMVSNMTHQHWQQLTKKPSAGYMTGYLMWALPAGTSSCAAKSADPAVSAQLAIMMQPLTPVVSAAARAVHSPNERSGSLPQQLGGEGAAPAERSFCLQQSDVPVVIRSGERPVSLSSLAFPAPHNMQQHLNSSFGPGWSSVPWSGQHHTQQAPPDWPHIQEALLSRLSVTAWGGLHWPTRKPQCLEPTAATHPDSSTDDSSGEQQQQQQQQQDRQSERLLAPPSTRQQQQQAADIPAAAPAQEQQQQQLWQPVDEEQAKIYEQLFDQLKQQQEGEEDQEGLAVLPGQQDDPDEHTQQTGGQQEQQQQQQQGTQDVLPHDEQQQQQQQPQHRRLREVWLPVG